MYGLSISLLRIEDGLHSLVLVIKYPRGSTLWGLFKCWLGNTATYLLRFNPIALVNFAFWSYDKYEERKVPSSCTARKKKKWIIGFRPEISGILSLKQCLPHPYRLYGSPRYTFPNSTSLRHSQGSSVSTPSLNTWSRPKPQSWLESEFEHNSAKPTFSSDYESGSLPLPSLCHEPFPAQSPGYAPETVFHVSQGESLPMARSLPE